jgi:hypothetical protein
MTTEQRLERLEREGLQSRVTRSWLMVALSLLLCASESVGSAHLLLPSFFPAPFWNPIWHPIRVGR